MTCCTKILANRLLLLALTVVAALLIGCTSERSDVAKPTSAASDAITQDDVLKGTVLRKEWTKSYESWNAGGSEYFVLDIGDAAVKERSAAEGVILRPSSAVSADVFAKHVGKTVEVTGDYVAAKPYVPVDETEPYPLGEDGNPAPRGSGFKVVRIQVLP